MDGQGNASRLLPRAGNWLALALQILLVVAGCIICTVYGFALFGDGAFGLALLLWMALQYPAIAIHELGHCAGARLNHMKVRVLQISALEFLPLRRGFRWRWNRLPRKVQVGGYVVAYVNPARPPRRSRLLMTAGGPAANLVVAGILFGLGEMLRPHAAGWVCLIFSVVNGGMGVVNLIPHRGTAASDGLLLWQLWRAGPGYMEDPFARLAGARMAGCTADRLPEEDLAALEAAEPVRRLFALWYRLKADQNRGDWALASSRQDAMDEALRQVDPSLLAALKDFLLLLRAELAFSRAMASHDGGGLSDDPIPPRLAWYIPYFRPRCLALRAALDGDEEGCERWLDSSRKHAERSNDAALALSEAMVAVHVRALFGRARSTSSLASEIA